MYLSDELLFRYQKSISPKKARELDLTDKTGKSILCCDESIFETSQWAIIFINNVPCAKNGPIGYPVIDLVTSKPNSKKALLSKQDRSFVFLERDFHPILGYRSPEFVPFWDIFKVTIMDENDTGLCSWENKELLSIEEKEVLKRKRWQ
jgi:hypothetical protein